MNVLKKTIDQLDRKGILLRFIALMALLALLMNLAVSWRGYRHEPLRDAASRSLMAAESSWFYAPGLAEPLPVAALKLAAAAGADPDAAVRLQGMALFVLLVVLTFFALRARLGPLAAVLAALFLAANPYLGYYAMQGASNLFALVFMVFFWHWFRPGAGTRRALLAGLAGGLACLSRLDAAPALLLIAGLAWAAERPAFRLREAGLALGLAALLAAPYLAWQRAHYGNALYAQELSLRRWANIDRYGYYPREAVPQGPLSPAAFVLRGGAAAAVSGAFSGLGRMAGFELPRVLHHKFLIVFVFLGAYASFVFGRWAVPVFLAAALLPLLPLAAVRQVPASGGIELRYYLGALWALCALAGFGLQELVAWGEKAAMAWARRKAAEYAAGKGKK